MAYAAPVRRSLLPLLLISVLSACSTDYLGVDNSRVSAIRPEGRVKPLPAGDMQAAYSGNPENIDDLSRPNMAGVGRTPLLSRTAALPPIDSDEAIALNGPTPSGGSQLGAPPRLLGQLHSQPQLASAAPGGIAGQGINIDSGLGLGEGTSLAQEEAAQIAEGNADQPVVDGIGTDNPVALNNGVPQSPAWPQPAPRQAGAAAGTQVAMLPRAIDPTVAPLQTPRPDIMPASEVSCRRALKQLGVKFQDVPTISNGPSCGIAYPIKVYGFASNIGMKPAITLNCEVTLAFAEWVKNELNPSARMRYWSGVRTIIPLGGYSCRHMNSNNRNPWSEHARGNAIDVGKFVLNSGKEIDVRKKGFFAFREKGLLNAVRSESCKYFHTVLGPGSDPNHKDHFHFDLRARKSGYRHCD